MKNNYTPTYSGNDVKILSRKTVYQGFFCIDKYQLQFKLFNGEWSQVIEREIFERGKSVAVLLVDPELDQVVLIEQFRPGAIEAIKEQKSPWLLEIVAGIIDREEKAEDVAYRETKEETGLTILELIPIAEYWVSPGGTSEKLSLFCGRVNSKNAHGIFGLSEEAEDIKVICLSVAEAITLLDEKRIQNVNTLVALQWLKINRNMLKKEKLSI